MEMRIYIEREPLMVAVGIILFLLILFYPLIIRLPILSNYFFDYEEVDDYES